jgi:hypothetical protein
VVQNSVDANAREIVLKVEDVNGTLRVYLADNGDGMDATTLARAQDPFFTDGRKHPGRRIGLGIPFLRQMVDATGGSFSIESETGRGTELIVTTPSDHIDLPPVGDLATVFQQAICFFGEFEMRIERRRDGRGYRLSRNELSEALGDLDTAGSQALLREYISAQEESLHTTEAHDGKDDVG